MTKKQAKPTKEVPVVSSTRKPRQVKTSPAPDAASSSSEKPLFFFKEDEENGFLCQWYRCSFTDPEIEEKVFNCTEQYMMYRKALVFDDSATAAKIMACTSPRKQKTLGREIAKYDEERWSHVRDEVVRRGNLLKFSQATNIASMNMDDVGDPVPLKDLLLATKDHELVEASPFDSVWGIGLKAEEAPKVARAKWGQNLLGKALMDVRAEIQRSVP